MKRAGRVQSDAHPMWFVGLWDPTHRMGVCRPPRSVFQLFRSNERFIFGVYSYSMTYVAMLKFCFLKNIILMLLDKMLLMLWPILNFGC